MMLEQKKATHDADIQDLNQLKIPSFNKFITMREERSSVFRPCERCQTEEFINIRDSLPFKHRLMITAFSIEEYHSTGSALFMTEDKRAGYGINPDGMLISVFAMPGSRMGSIIVDDAIHRGASYTECFDINGKLPGLYRRFGFEEVARFGWSYDHAPKKWDYENLGKPDVILMARTSSISIVT